MVRFGGDRGAFCEAGVRNVRHHQFAHSLEHLGLVRSEVFYLTGVGDDVVQAVGGAGSVVWHPILFGGARDPGYADVFWYLVDAVKARGGWATDGRHLNAYVRARATGYPSFSVS